MPAVTAGALMSSRPFGPKSASDYMNRRKSGVVCAAAATTGRSAIRRVADGTASIR
jgi:hypothetical protein